MLEAIRGEKNKLKERLSKLEERERIVMEWLAEEQPQQELPIGTHPKLQIRPRLGSFLQDTIADGKPRTNAELAELAKTRGIVEEDVDLRKINSIMLGFMNAGYAERKDGKWISRRKSG